VKVGDLVTDDFYEDAGLVVSAPRMSGSRDHMFFGMMEGDVYEVVDVLCTDGTVRPLLTNELRLLNESRNIS